MWVGESERQVRELFARAREKAKEGFLPFIFIDEAESILGTRRAGRTSGILNTLVPMFCAEMDGIESLQQMVIILASNRADMIDPAILATRGASTERSRFRGQPGKVPRRFTAFTLHRTCRSIPRCWRLMLTMHKKRSMRS